MRMLRRGKGPVALAALAILAAGTMLPSAAAAQPVQELVDRGAAAGADLALLTELRDRALRMGLDAETTARLLVPVVETAEAGLPSRAMAQRGLEGLAKGVPPNRISAVLVALGDGVHLAAGIVDPWLARSGVPERLGVPGEAGRDAARAAIVEGAGVALFQDAPEEAVRALLDRVPDGIRRARVAPLEVAVAVEVLADLPSAARNPELAAEVVAWALEVGFGSAELRELPAAMRAAESRGELPAEMVARGTLHQMGRDLPARVILENLFRGDFPGDVPFDLPPGMERARDRVGPPDRP